MISPANLGDCSPDSAPHNVLPDMFHLDGAGQCIGLIYGFNKHRKSPFGNFNGIIAEK
jgi:hypothetical protein